MDIFEIMKQSYQGSQRATSKMFVRQRKQELINLYGLAAYNDMVRAVNNGAPIEDVLEHYSDQEEAIQVKKAPPIMGSAKWATREHLARAQLLHDPDDITNTQDVYFGAFHDRNLKTRKQTDSWLYWNGNSHLITIAPTGAGKSAVQIIPNILSYEGSIFVFDPKGELYRATSFHRSQIGKVYRLAPFEEGSNSFNPLHNISSMDDAIELAQIVFPSEAQGDGAFYENEARGFLAALIYLVSQQPENTMGRIREITSLPQEDFKDLVQDIAEHTGLPTPIIRAAQLVCGFKKGIITTLQRSLFEKLQIWDSEAIQKVTNQSDFDFSEMKKGTVTVYVTVPFHRIEAYSHYVQTMMTKALEGMVSTPERPKIPVLFLLDEFLALGPFPRFVNALRTHRDAGVRLWFFLQSVADLEATYPQHWKSFFTAAEVKSFFGVRDHYTGELVSQMLSNETLSYTVSNTNSNLSMQGGDSFFGSGQNSNSTSVGTSNNTTVIAKPLLDPSEVQKALGVSEPNGARGGIVNLPGLDPVEVIHVPWYVGYRFWCRFGSRENQHNQSALLNALWSAFNRDFFNGQLKEPSAIEYQDFSMGRNGYMPFEPGVRAFHDSEYDRIIFMEICKQVEDAYWKVANSNREPDEQIADITFAFLARILLHEMIHQATYQLGSAPKDDHGPTFARYAMEVYTNSQAISGGFQFIPPSKQTLSQWPMMMDLDDVLDAVGAWHNGSEPGGHLP